MNSKITKTKSKQRQRFNRFKGLCPKDPEDNLMNMIKSN